MIKYLYTSGFAYVRTFCESISWDGYGFMNTFTALPWTKSLNFDCSLTVFLMNNPVRKETKCYHDTLTFYEFFIYLIFKCFIIFFLQKNPEVFTI